MRVCLSVTADGRLRDPDCAVVVAGRFSVETVLEIGPASRKRNDLSTLAVWN